MKMILSLLLSMLVFVACSDKSSKPTNKTELLPAETIANKAVLDSDKVEKSLQTQIKQLSQHPSLTLVLMPKKDLQESIANLEIGGGKLIYDPNNGYGSSIPFYIAELTPEQINDTNFLKSLKLSAATIDSKKSSLRPIETKLSSTDLNFTNFIPTDSVNLSQLGDVNTLGEGITVAVIDTGVDASHPAFGNRVSYWYDGTEETKTELKKVEITDNSVELSVGNSIKKILLPEFLPEGEIYAAIMSENNFSAQLSADLKKDGFLDLNDNKSGDNFLVIAVKKDGKTKIFFDHTGDLKLAGTEEKLGKINYNETTKKNRSKGMVSFPTRNNILSYPVMLEEEGDKVFLTLGKTSGMHGTHVAGIIAANDVENNLLGAAPLADIMSLKVCSGISCTDSAIIKGLYKAFYNGKIIPDVVNISLGSHEHYSRDAYSHVFNDLSAKFGTIFFISASNSGPGFRSLNHFGNSGSVVMVGANVSDKTLRDQYNLSNTATTQNENLLFFSSLGPSYTGEMKPNIIAPGAAISAVPAAYGYMAQANGTSMSSPLAAGAFASVLGVLKANGHNSFETINSMRKAHLKRQIKADRSLLPYVYAMRDALQNAAEEQPALTRAQQGYGLLRAGKTRTLLASYMNELNDGSRDYFEVSINDFKKGYDRSGKLKKVASFKLGLENDGERSKKSLAKIIAAGVDVELSRVEVLDTNGNVEKLINSDALKFFSIIDRGNDNNKMMSTHVTFNNRRTSDFHSRRNLALMETGKTYIAHYVVKSKGFIINNILDIVHMPFKLEEREVSIPSINPEVKKVSKGFGLSNIEIKTNVFHRYPIYIDKTTHKVKVDVALLPETQGRLYVQLYDPTGKEVDFKVAQNSSLNAYKKAKINVTTFKDSEVKEGIWELTISTSSSAWLSDAKYDLLITGTAFGVKSKTQKVKIGKEAIIPVQIENDEVTKLLVSNTRQVLVQNVETKSSHVSFQKLNLPGDYIGNVTLSIKDDKESYWGKLIQKLYIKSGESFKAYSGQYSMSEGVITLKEALKGEVYFALDTFTNYTDSSLESSVSSKVRVEAEYSVKNILNKVKTSIKNVPSMNIALVEVLVGESKSIKLEGISESYAKADLLIISGKVEVLNGQDGEIFSIDPRALINKVELEIR